MLESVATPFHLLFAMDANVSEEEQLFGCSVQVPRYTNLIFDVLLPFYRTRRRLFPRHSIAFSQYLVLRTSRVQVQPAYEMM